MQKKICDNLANPELNPLCKSVSPGNGDYSLGNHISNISHSTLTTENISLTETPLGANVENGDRMGNAGEDAAKDDADPACNTVTSVKQRISLIIISFFKSCNNFEALKEENRRSKCARTG